MSEFRVLSKQIIAPETKRMDIVAPSIVSKAKPGQFVLVMPTEKTQRLALPIVEASAQKNAITLIFREQTLSEKALGNLAIGEKVHAVLGPLGDPILEDAQGIVVCIGHELGIAQVLPLCRYYQKKGNKVFGILGAATRKTIILEPAMRVSCHSAFVVTADGSAGKKGSVADMLRQTIAGHAINHVYVAANTANMQDVVSLCRSHKIKVSVVVKPFALSGIGFCGTDEVKVGKEYVLMSARGCIFNGEVFDLNFYQNKEESRIA